MAQAQKMSQEQKTSKKRLTLRELINKGQPVWVLNKTGENGKGKYPGNVVFQVGSGDNIGTVAVPPGDDPICITDQIDGDSLKTCRDLFNLVNTGYLELLDPENVEEYYDKNAQRKKIVEDKINRVKENIPDNVPLPKSADAKLIEDVMNPKVGAICRSAKRKEISERDALEGLIEQSRTFTAVEYNYIAINGQYEALKKWAKERLEEAKK